MIIYGLTIPSIRYERLVLENFIIIWIRVSYLYPIAVQDLSKEHGGN